MTDKTRRRGRKNKTPNKEQFEYQYYTLQMPVKELAEFYKVKPGTIYNWASKFNKSVL